MKTIIQSLDNRQGHRLNQALVISELAPSRRAADKIIQAGQVYLNDKKITNLNQRIKDEQLPLLRIGLQLGKVSTPSIILLNKPKGYVCSHEKTDKSPIIFNLLPKTFQHYKMSGRLDKNSSGLIVLSNQAQALSGLEHTIKVYEVITDKNMPMSEQEEMIKGLRIKGRIYKLNSIAPITGRSYRLELISGYYHQIKVMFDYFGLTVRNIHRVSVGPYHQSMLQGKRFKSIKPISHD